MREEGSKGGWEEIKVGGEERRERGTRKVGGRGVFV